MPGGALQIFDDKSKDHNPQRIFLHIVGLFITQVLRTKILLGDKSIDGAFKIYCLVMNTKNNSPAYLYKLKDAAQISWGSPYWDQMKTQGSVYAPEVHHWAMNSVWMLAHLHKRNKFHIISQVNQKNLMRSNNKAKYSAFAKELATAMNAGYIVTKVTIRFSRITIVLSPTRSRDGALSLSLKDCAASDESCRKGIELFNASLLNFSLTQVDLYEIIKPNKNSNYFIKEFITTNVDAGIYSGNINFNYTYKNIIKQEKYLNYLSNNLFAKPRNTDIIETFLESQEKKTKKAY